MREDDVAIIELDGKRRAGKDLLDVARYLERGLFGYLWSSGFGHPRARSLTSIANGYLRLLCRQFEALENLTKDRSTQMFQSDLWRNATF